MITNLVKYVRDSSETAYSEDWYCGRGTPFAAIAITDNGIGVSICNPKDRFTKRIGRKIALARATYNRIPNFPTGRIYYYDPVTQSADWVSIEEAIKTEIDNLKRRWERVKNGPSKNEGEN